MSMSPKLFRQRIADLLLSELKTGKFDWYYISMVHVDTNKFIGAFLVPGAGPTDAWLHLHSLIQVPPGTETLTILVSQDELENIPEEKRLRLLNREEIESLGK